MSSTSYEKLSIEIFGRHLLESGDLDPVYIVLHEMQMPEEQLHRWLIAYWCFYDCGVASYLSEFSLTYWDVMMEAAINTTPTPIGTRWPRGKERRHFRGQQGIDAMQELMQKYPNNPTDMVKRIVDGGDPSYWELANGKLIFNHVSERVKTHRGFGPWIAFKICDMLERVTGAPVDFTQSEIFMFKDPVEAAVRLWRLKAGLPDNAEPKDKAAAITQVVDYLRMYFKDFTAPPSHDRAVGLQEIETILCKWKSHCNGHYPINNDLIEIRDGVEPWVGVSKTAKEFLHFLPKPIELAK